MAYHNRACTDVAQQNYAAAMPDVNQTIALRPDYVDALMIRGDLGTDYYAIDDDTALADYDRVLALPSGVGREHTSRAVTGSPSITAETWAWW